MKELSIEEKAKAYDDLLVKLQKAKVDNDVCDERYCCVIDDIVPELKESDDEKIRKEIIDFVKSRLAGFPDCKRFTDWLEKQGKQKVSCTTLVETGNGGINALVTRELSTNGYSEQKSANKVEPKFKVKYAGREYNVLEVKDVAGVTFYGIEDEPNHIDYVQAENCERVGGYSIKEDGSPFPTQTAKFSEQKPVWSEEDEIGLGDAMWAIKQARTIAKDENDMGNLWYAEDWLKSLKERYIWKPTDEQMDNLSRAFNGATYRTSLLRDLYLDLKKLK